MASAEVYLALGSNLGERSANLQAALDRLAPQVRLLKASPIYETEPWGYADQPAFLNQAAQAETDLPPLELLAHLKQIEGEMGRQATFRNGPRLIDLDILLYGDLILDTPALTIPHPRLHERAFVLAPLVDLAPQFVHPVLHRNMAQLLAKVDCKGVKLYAADA